MRSAPPGPSRSPRLAEKAHGERVHGVAGVDRDRHAGAAMHGGTAAPRFAAVLDVVVHEKRVVQHFEAGRRRTARPRARPPSARAVAMHSAGRKPLPDRLEEILTKP